MNKSALPLRLILTHNCNGKCDFCHREGYSGRSDMSLEDIEECINTAKKLSIPCIALTGGEPTLRHDLSDIISLIRKIYPQTQIHLTTNGLNLATFQKTINAPIDVLNLSIFSLDENKALKFQNFSPNKAIMNLLQFPAINKNLNIVVADENICEIKDIIKKCIINHISLVLMFDLRNNNNNTQYYNKVIEIIRNFGSLMLEGNIPPTLVCNINDKTKIKIKHPKLSRMSKWNVCEQCNENENCTERICAVRVHPDGIVTPCLNRTICADGDTLSAKISTMYNKILKQ